MSRKQSKPTRQRFSGPELSELLDEVVASCGSTAAITAVNRVRSGGVAGFFCREEFEVLVEPTALVDLSIPSETKRSTTSREAGAATVTKVAPTPEVGDSGELDKPRVATEAERKAAVRAVFGGPDRPDREETDARFRALLERRLDETSRVESARAEAELPGPRPRSRRQRPESLKPKVEDVRRGVVPAPGHAPGAVGRATSTTAAPIGRLAKVDAASGFWLRLQRAQHELASFMPVPSPFVAVVGPLSLTSPIVRKLRDRPGLNGADIIVLTDRAEIVSEPTWQLVRSGHQLVELAEERGDWPTIVLIDVPVEVPNWVAPLQNRLRLAGVGLFRYAVPGTPTVREMDSYRQQSDVPYLVDLVSRVDPSVVVELVAERHPIGSVSGADLNAELLVAMRDQVSGG